MEQQLSDLISESSSILISYQNQFCQLIAAGNKPADSSCAHKKSATNGDNSSSSEEEAVYHIVCIAHSCMGVKVSSAHPWQHGENRMKWWLASWVLFWNFKDMHGGILSGVAFNRGSTVYNVWMVIWCIIMHNNGHSSYSYMTYVVIHQWIIQWHAAVALSLQGFILTLAISLDVVLWYINICIHLQLVIHVQWIILVDLHVIGKGWL